MITLANYFEYKDDIENILVIAEHDSTKDLLIKMCSTMPALKKMYLAGTTAKRLAQFNLSLKRAAKEKTIFFLPEIILVPYVKEINYNFDCKIDAVLFDSNTKKAAILSTRNLNPVYLIGKLWRDFVPCFHIWEEFRSISNYIHIECIGKANKVDVLDWKKNPNCNVELSIIFPVYNVAKYLDQCIQSVTAWKAPYVEFLFVNDGSPDNSRDIILEAHKKDSRIKLIDKPNGGCASARKRGMEESKGRYIGFVDPDDYVDEDMFKKLFSRAIIGSYDISYSGYNAYYENSGKSERIDDALGYPYVLGTTDKLAIQKLIMYLRVAIWRGIYRADFLNDNHITFQENLRRFDDLPFKVEVCAKAKSAIAVPEYLYYYRLERPGQDVACDDDRLYVHFDIFEHLDKEIGAIKDQKLLDFLQLAKVQTHCFTLQKIQKKYLNEYCRMAKNDFKKNKTNIFRTLLLIVKYFGGKNAVPYLAIMFRCQTFYMGFLNVRRNLK